MLAVRLQAARGRRGCAGHERQRVGGQRDERRRNGPERDGRRRDRWRGRKFGHGKRGYDGGAATGGSSGSSGAGGSTGLGGTTDGGCVPESDSAFCMRLGKNCGSVAASDNCQLARTANCGSCTLPQSCGGSATTNLCCALAAGSISTGGTVTASNPGTSPEDMTKAFDGSVLTKWFVYAVTTPWIQ